MIKKIARLFVNGKSQAVRLPKEFEYTDINEVEVTKEGDTVTIQPVRVDWVSFGKLPKLGGDFMSDRDQDFKLDRVKL